MVEVKYTPRKPRTERDRTVSPDKRERLRLKKGMKNSSKTIDLKSDARRRRFINDNPLKEGELYISWRPPTGGRRHAVISEDMEFSRDGESWQKINLAGEVTRNGNNNQDIL